MNMRAVVLDDGARPVNDLLVAFDLRDDLLLHVQWGEGDLVCFTKSSIYSLESVGSGHLCNPWDSR